jgi:hypothetical protein
MICVVVAAGRASAQANKYIAEDAEWVFTVNVRQILDSKLVKDNQQTVDLLKKELQNQIDKNRDVANLQKVLGFDPFRDLNSITFAAPGGKDPHKGMIVINGTIDAKKLADAAQLQQDKIKVHQNGARKIYEIPIPDKNETLYLTLANKNDLVLTGSLDGLKAALSQFDAGRPSASKELQTLLARTNAQQSISFVATRSGLEKFIKDSGNPQAQAIAPLVQQIEGVTSSITFAKDIDFQITVEAKDAETAKKLAKDTTQGLVFLNLMVQGQAQQNPQLAPAVDIVKTLRTSAQGNTVIISGRVTAEVVQQGIKMIPNFPAP